MTAQLFDAIADGDVGVAEEMIKQGCDVNLLSEDGVTPIHSFMLLLILVTCQSSN